MKRRIRTLATLFVEILIFAVFAYSLVVTTPVIPPLADWGHPTITDSRPGNYSIV